MRDWHIQVAGINMISVLDVEVYKGVNEHGYAKVKGVIDSQNEDALVQAFKQSTYTQVVILDEDKSARVLFCGMITEFEIESEGFSKTVEVKMVGATYFMDCIVKTKSFQDKAMTYEELFQNVNNSYGAARCFMEQGEKPIGDMIAQYKETDWTFAKRLASHFNQPIIPYWMMGKIIYSVGLQKNGKTTTIADCPYKLQTRKDEYFYNISNGLKGYALEDADTYEIKTRDLLELGEAVIFRGKTLYVYEVKSKYVGDELVHTCILRTENGFKTVKKYNMNLIGASLDASILAVQRDTVKIHINVDATQDEGSAKWFPYSTVYSSADGTGWYCMPEKGDKVRLYFPNEKEEEGYVISSINVGSSGGEGPRSNPDNKSISNKYNKQIELTPTTITMTNNAGLTVCLDDEEGISIISNKQVSIMAQEDLIMMSTAGQVNINASESIVMSQGGSTLTLKDDVILEGGKFLVQ